MPSVVSEHGAWSRAHEGKTRSETLGARWVAKDDPNIFYLNNWKDEVAIKLGWARGFEGTPGAELQAGKLRCLIDIQVQLNLEFR